MKRIFVTLLALILAMSCLVGCTEEPEVEQTETQMAPEDEVRATVDGFFAAYNSGDYEGMKDCLGEEQQVILDKTISVIGDLADFDMSSIMPLLFGMSADVLEGEMLTFEIDKIEVDGDSAKVYGDMNVNMGEVNQESYAMIKLTKEADGWKIAYINPEAKSTDND